jgi:hypothetical protein
MDNFSDLQQPGFTSDQTLDIALTARDTIKLTKDLGYPYLWVDW